MAGKKNRQRNAEHAPSVAKTFQIMGRYELQEEPPLGTGAWCVVRQGVDLVTNRRIAAKSFNVHAYREMGEEFLRDRFAREVGIFQDIGLAPTTGSTAAAASAAAPTPGESGARDLLVNLLDFSRLVANSDEPGPAEDGRCYTILELADTSLQAWLRKRLGAKQFVTVEELRFFAHSVAEGLSCLHARGLFHLDVKPENIMLFGSRWKLIDLEGCLRGGRKARIVFSPLYASPELAKFALERGSEDGLEPTAAMDVWAAGLVLLDMLVHGSALEETKAGLDTSNLFEEQDVVPHEAWYRWLADDAPLDLDTLLASAPGSSRELILIPELRDLLQRLLHKDPARRLTMDLFCQHPFFAGCAGGVGVLAATWTGEAPSPLPPPIAAAAVAAMGTLCAVDGGSQRSLVEAGFRVAQSEGALPEDGTLPAEVFLELFVALGLARKQAHVLLREWNALGKERLACDDLIDFLYA